jgi:phage terminase large subunit-like protein
MAIPIWFVGLVTWSRMTEDQELLALLEEQERREFAKTVVNRAKDASRDQANAIYDEVLADDNREAQRNLCKYDLFFLLSRACKRKDMDRDWLYDRCREVQANPDGYLDLWAREHYKSTIITFGKSIQDILVDPEICIGIFSHTRPVAKAFLEQIKRELEQNEYLKRLFDDVLYARPQYESPKWSLDNGLLVKRKSNPKEATIEASGLVDGQPTGKHYTLRIYDDVVTKESVTTPEQIKKTTEAWELSSNLGAEGGRSRHIGTRYHSNDTYKAIINKGSAIPRIYTATDNGKMDGKPVLLSEESLITKRRDQGPYVFSCQQLQNPVADNQMGFDEKWLKFYKSVEPTKWNKYIVVDPASKKKKTSDYTVMLVLGLAPDNNYYLLDIIRDRLNLTQRADKLFELHRKWMPQNVGYEEYGAQADVEHMQYKMEQENYRFNITRLGGGVAKEDRIQKLVPIFEQSRMWLPERFSYVNYEGRQQDLVRSFIDDEYLSFPVSTHDDMLDCLARILEPVLGAKFPKIQEKPKYNATHSLGSGGWMG